MDIINIGIMLLEAIAIFAWSSYTAFALLGLLANILYTPKRSEKRAVNVEFVIVSIASHSVKNALYECIEHTRKNFNHTLKYPITILINEEAELKNEIYEFIKNIPKIRIIEVPYDYNKELIGKGRAINYFVENNIQETEWYVFLDDDNIILDDKFLYEIPYYDKQNYAVANPILIPREAKSKLSYLMDYIRFTDDMMIFKFFTGLLKKPLLGLHGELLITKGKYLKSINSYKIASLTEDYVYSANLIKQGYKSWQSKTRVSIKSPNTINDLFKQRKRWYSGISGYLFKSPTEQRLVVGLRLILWNLGIFSGWLLVPLWIFVFHLPLFVFFIFLIGAGYYWLSYIYGIVKSKSWICMLLIPVMAVLETLSIYLIRKTKNFHVINKN